ncbi:MAG: preprotein translocase subunit SecG [Rhodanobacter sp.]
MFAIFSVFYLLVASVMTVLILMQNGAGAGAGSGFGGGASATVFGARGSATFLTRATGVLGALFFALSLGMGVYMHHHGAPAAAGDGLGVMAGVATKPAAANKTSPAVVPAGSEVPAAAGATANKAATPPAAAAVEHKSEVPATPAAPAPEKKN